MKPEGRAKALRYPPSRSMAYRFAAASPPTDDRRLRLSTVDWTVD
jgi:hypothetical protein